MKSQKFEEWTYVGDVVNSARIFNQKDVDEIILIDSDASKIDREPDFDLITEVASECFMPITYGGGISSVEIAERVIACGVDKVIVNSAFRKIPSLIHEIAAVIGASSTVVCIDYFHVDGKYFVFDHVNGNSFTSTPEEMISQVLASGAGEVIFQNVQLDGTLSGPDMETVMRIARKSSIPITYLGGVSALEEVFDLWDEGIDAVAAGSWFVFRGQHKAVLINYPSRQSIEAFENS